MPGRRTRIDAGHIIAYQDGGHRYLRNGVIVVEGQEIVYVGPRDAFPDEGAGATPTRRSTPARCC